MDLGGEVTNNHMYLKNEYIYSFKQLRQQTSYQGLMRGLS